MQPGEGVFLYSCLPHYPLSLKSSLATPIIKRALRLRLSPSPTLGSRTDGLTHSAMLACMRTSGIQTQVLTPARKHSYPLSLLFSPQSTALQRTSPRTLQQMSTASMMFRFSKYFVILPPNKCTFCEMLQKTLKRL